MLTVKKGKHEEQTKRKDVEVAVMSFIDTKAKIDALNEELKRHKEVLVAAAQEFLENDEAQTITFGVDDERVKITFGYDIRVTDEAGLEAVLGERFGDLVDVSVTYKPTQKLKEMALQDTTLTQYLSVRDKAPAVSIVK